ncbi:Uncharacterised protein [uncultured archaeon]|nr:Uncharacterised protein [uncultured archaeon]
MILHTASSDIEVRLVGGRFIACVLNGPNAGKHYEGDTINGTKMGAKFTLTDKGKLLCQSTTVQRVEGTL